MCVHKDVLGQMVYGWDIGLTMETKLVIRSLKKMTKSLLKFKQETDRIILHQDRGSQYTSYEYVEAALKVGKLSYSDPGTPTHNPGQESFFGRFKDEWRDEISEIETFGELKKFVRSKIDYYNYERRHTSIGLMSPRDYTKSFLKNNT